MWGLSHYLIVEKNFGAEQVKASALEWLRLIQPDYYVIQELEARGVNPDVHGLSWDNPCYAGKCELPFGEGGCGGMGELKL